MQHKLLSGFGAGTVVGLGMSIIFVPATILGWLGFLAIGAAFGLAGLLVGWMGWRRACQDRHVALLGSIIPLASFLMVVDSPALSWAIRFSNWELGGWLATICLWFLINLMGGWLAATAVTWH